MTQQLENSWSWKAGNTHAKLKGFFTAAELREIADQMEPPAAEPEPEPDPLAGTPDGLVGEP